MKKTYKIDYILKNYDAGTIQKLAGVPAFVTSRLIKKSIRLTGKTSAKLKYFYNRVMHSKLKESGIPRDKRSFLIQNFTQDVIKKESTAHLEIAKIIYRNKKKKNKKIKLQDIINGMTKSFRQDIGDWIIYIKEMRYKSSKRSKSKLK